MIYQVAASGSCVTKEGKDVTVLVSRDIINNKDWTCISFLDQKKRSVSFSMKCLGKVKPFPSTISALLFSYLFLCGALISNLWSIVTQRSYCQRAKALFKQLNEEPYIVELDLRGTLKTILCCSYVHSLNFGHDS